MVNNSFHNVAGPFSLEILAKLVNGKIYDGSKNNDFGSDKYLIYGASDIDNASKLILPGVGHFGKAMYNLKNKIVVLHNKELEHQSLWIHYI